MIVSTIVVEWPAMGKGRSRAAQKILEFAMSARLHQRPRDRYDDLVAAYPELFPPPRPDYARSDLPGGWWSLVTELASRLMKLPGREKIRITQTKEKVGQLMIHVRLASGGGLVSDPQMEALQREISLARERSASTCLFCGAADAERRILGGWITTVCPNHSYGSTAIPASPHPLD